MEWNYKNVIIEVDVNGKFLFSFNGKCYSESTLSFAKDRVDELTKNYYTFTEEDKKRMFKKLNDRERDLVSRMMDELKCHQDNPYCDLDIYDDILFNIM